MVAYVTVHLSCSIVPFGRTGKRGYYGRSNKTRATDEKKVSSASEMQCS